MSEDLKEMSGETVPQRAPRLPLNEIKLNGTTGKFVFVNKIDGLKDIDGKKAYEEIEIKDEKIETIWLKIRRKLFFFSMGQKPLKSSEHNHKGDYVTLSGGVVDKGTAEQMRARYEMLRVEQIMYALYKGELVRLAFKGSALGSQSPVEGVMKFYDYISSFKKDKRDEHFYECKTILSPVQEEYTKDNGEKKSYYSTSFAEGDKLTEKETKEVVKKMTLAHEFCVLSDKYYAANVSKKMTGMPPVVSENGEVETIEYPEGDDINPTEIPF